MPIRKLLIASAISVMAFGTASAHDYKAGSLEISHPWARATAPGQTMGAGYLTIENNGASDDKLISVTTDAAAMTEVHEVVNENNMAKMRAVEAIAIPKGQTTKLAPGGYHVMFMNIKAPFKEGEKIHATLTFEKAGPVKVDFAVEPLTYQGGNGHGGHGDMKRHGK